jgi:hypothetical protein
MPSPCLRLALPLCLLLLPSGLRADDDASEIPTVGRPADLPFSEASGDFRVRASAEPTTLIAQHPFILTLTVEALAEVRQPPRRIDLREMPAFAERFDFPEGDNGEERRPNQQTWEFVYRLQPKRMDVTSVPGVPFVFFNPEIQYPRKGFQVAYTEAIPLTVAPAPVFVVPVTAPERIFAIASGSPLLEQRSPSTAPGLLIVGVLLLAPPMLCAAWYLGWKRLYPDAARLAQQRRSVAARRALQALRGTDRLPPPQRSARVAAVVADYLRARLDAPAEEPTPVEAAACLQRGGCSPALAEQAAGFFRSCDAARFGPEGAPIHHDLPAEAAHIILAVEAETWSTSQS